MWPLSSGAVRARPLPPAKRAAVEEAAKRLGAEPVVQFRRSVAVAPGIVDKNVVATAPHDASLAPAQRQSIPPIRLGEAIAPASAGESKSCSLRFFPTNHFRKSEFLLRSLLRARLKPPDANGAACKNGASEKIPRRSAQPFENAKNAEAKGIWILWRPAWILLRRALEMFPLALETLRQVLELFRPARSG
jgi:hypothetical protein